jgi:hypothetical protein
MKINARTIVVVDDVKRAVAHVKKLAEAGDDEAAHGAEDALHQAVLRRIVLDGPMATPVSKSVEMAAEALKTAKIKFGRWTA